MKKIAGIDGSKGGWVCVSGYENNYEELKFEKLKEFNDVKSKNFNLVLVDIPIGLDIDLKKGGRIVDKLARKELLTNKSSIFNAPSRLVLDAKNYEEANTRFLLDSAFSGYLIGVYLSGAGNNPINNADSLKFNLETSFPKKYFDAACTP